MRGRGVHDTPSTLRRAEGKYHPFRGKKPISGKMPSESVKAQVQRVSNLNYLLRLLHWSGALCYPLAAPLAIRAFYLRRLGVVSTFLVFLCSQTIAMLREGTADMQRFTMALCTFNSGAILFFRVLHAAMNESQFQHLALQVNDDLAEFANASDVSLIGKRSRVLRLFVLSYLWYGVADCIWWTTFPTIRNGLDPAGLSYIMALPYDVMYPPAFIATWCFLAYITVDIIMITIAFDSLIVSLISQLRLQLNLLGRKFINITSDIDKDNVPSFQDVVGETLASRKDLDIRQVEYRLRRNLMHHQAIIRNTEMLEKCLRTMLLPQSLSIGAVVCFQLFQIATSEESLAAAGNYIAYLAVMSIELFVYCWFGDGLIDESHKVSLAAYSSLISLQGYPLSLQKSVLIFMGRAHRPLCITAGGLFPISREAFVSVVNMSYSFFAILRNFKE